MIGNCKLSDLPDKHDWDSIPIPQRVVKCHDVGLEGKVAGKSWENLTIFEALSLTGKLPKIPHWQDPLMSPADYERARQNRERQHVVYPDGKEETDESKERRRAERRAERSVRVAQLKQTPVWDPVNMRMVWK